MHYKNEEKNFDGLQVKMPNSFSIFVLIKLRKFFDD